MASLESIQSDIKVLENMLAWEEFDSRVEALREAIYYLSKQIPQSIQKDKNGLISCPSCKEIITDVNKYCTHCGQKFITN